MEGCPPVLYMQVARRRNGPVGYSRAAAVSAYATGQLVRSLAKRGANYIAERASKRSRQSISGSPVTTQHDVRGRYRYKRMPARRRKRWVRFSKRVRHVMLQQNALSSYSQDTVVPYLNLQWLANKQITFGVMLGGTTVTFNDELFQLFRQAYDPALTTTTCDAYKLFIKSMCLDVQLKCDGNAAIVDVYELVCRKTYNAATDLGTSYNNLYAEMDSPAVNSPDALSPASTPFENSPFLKFWKIKSKKELFLGTGQVTTMQMRSPINRALHGAIIRNNPQAIPGLTRAYLFQARGAPRYNGASSELGAGTIIMSYQIGVNYAKPPGSSVSVAGDI